MNIFENKKDKNKRKGIKIWPLVGAIYGPIIFWILIINLPKVEWKYVFESNKTRGARHHKKAEDIGLPGIPYWRNSGSAAILYLNRDGVAYAMCGPDFFCSEELNAKKVFILCLLVEGLEELIAKLYLQQIAIGVIAMILIMQENVDQVDG